MSGFFFITFCVFFKVNSGFFLYNRVATLFQRRLRWICETTVSTALIWCDENRLWDVHRSNKATLSIQFS